jgi:hypothetical protein
MIKCLEAGQGFSLSIPISFPNKIDHNEITEILLKVAFNSYPYLKKLGLYYFF